MDPREFLKLASDLSVGNTEAEWRTGASRAYYSAFHMARELLIQLGFAVPATEQAHAYMYLRLSNSGHHEISKAGQRLARLRSDRNLADYRLDLPFQQKSSPAAYKMGDEIIQILDDALTLPHVLSQITTAMRDYERNILKQVTWHP